MFILLIPLESTNILTAKKKLKEILMLVFSSLPQIVASGHLLG